MPTKFHGNLLQLKNRVEQCGVRGKWRYIEVSGLYQFQAETGENLNWWPSTGTLMFQSRDVYVLQDRYERLFLPIEARRAAEGCGKRNGLDEAARGREPRSRWADETQRVPQRPKRRFR